MLKQFHIDNSGIGTTPHLTFANDERDGVSFTQELLDEGLSAAVITNSNKIGLGYAGNRLAGNCVWVSGETINGTNTPVLTALACRGCNRFKYSTPIPVLHEGVEVDGTGRVRAASSEAHGRGEVFELNEENKTCDVWLG